MVNRRKTHAQNLGQQDQWELVNIRLVNDPHKQGTHAGLPHFRLDVVHEGKKVAYVDVHLHHNKNGLSVGTTTCCFTRLEGGPFKPLLMEAKDFL